MEIEINFLSSHQVEDFIHLIDIFGDVFEMEELKIPDSQYLQHLLDKPDFFVLVGKHDGRVVGGLTMYVIHRYTSKKPVAYIYDVGVTPEHQRKGVGKKLISYLTQYCQENGFEDAYVEAESDDSQAVNFYKTTPATIMSHATLFTYTFDVKEP